MNQVQVEALYSHRQNSTILYEAVKNELDGFLLNWTLKVWYAIENYLEGEYYDSKNERLETLRTFVDMKGMEHLLIKILCAVIHTQNSQTYQQCIGYLQAALPHEDSFARAVTAGELIALGASDSRRGLYSIVRNDRDYTNIEVNRWHLIDDKLLSSFDWINDSCFNPPLVEKPLEVKDNYHCGYHTIREPLILGDYTMHDGPQNLEAINTLNEIEWLLDPHVLAEPEPSPKPFKNRQARENFIQMVQESQHIYELLSEEPFWFAWQYDSRGRIYSHGYHVNFQAAEYKKALLNFNHFEELS